LLPEKHSVYEVLAKNMKNRFWATAPFFRHCFSDAAMVKKGHFKNAEVFGY